MTASAAAAPPAHTAVFIVEDHPFLARSLGELVGDHLEVLAGRVLLSRTVRERRAGDDDPET